MRKSRSVTRSRSGWLPRTAEAGAARRGRDAADEAGVGRTRAGLVGYDVALLPCARARQAASRSVSAGDRLHAGADGCMAMEGREHALAGGGGSYLQDGMWRESADDGQRAACRFCGGVGLDGERPGLNSHLHLATQQRRRGSVSESAANGDATQRRTSVRHGCEPYQRIRSSCGQPDTGPLTKIQEGRLAFGEGARVRVHHAPHRPAISTCTIACRCCTR